MRRRRQSLQHRKRRRQSGAGLGQKSPGAAEAGTGAGTEDDAGTGSGRKKKGNAPVTAPAEGGKAAQRSAEARSAQSRRSGRAKRCFPEPPACAAKAMPGLWQIRERRGKGSRAACDVGLPHRSRPSRPGLERRGCSCGGPETQEAALWLPVCVFGADTMKKQLQGSLGPVLQHFVRFAAED